MDGEEIKEIREIKVDKPVNELGVSAAGSGPGSGPVIMDPFRAAVEFVFSVEGRYSNDPDDPGGETWYGISRKAFPELSPWPPDKATAESVYRSVFWNGIRGDDLPGSVAIVVFDAAVNMGLPTAARLLQTSLEIHVDGVIGPETVRAARAAGVKVLESFMTRRVLKYVSLSGFSRFGAGWIRRCFGVHALALRYAYEKSALTLKWGVGVSELAEIIEEGTAFARRIESVIDKLNRV